MRKELGVGGVECHFQESPEAGIAFDPFQSQADTLTAPKT